MADQGKSYNEHDDHASFPQRRKKGQGPFRWKYGDRNRQSGRGVRSSQLEEDDVDVAMSETLDGPRRDRALPERGGAGTSQDGTSKNWFKISIPFGKKYEKSWLLGMIQSKCSIPFTPVEFHYENTRAQFFVEDASTASALKAMNCKTVDRNNQKISIIINSSATPHTVQNELKPEQGSYFGTENLKSLVLHFLQQYYAIYDSGDWQELLDAYHDGACCLLNIPFMPQNPAQSNLSEYFKDSRNVKKLKDPTLQFWLLKHTLLNIVAFLRLCIVNDELFVQNTSPEEIQSAFTIPAPMPSSSPVPTLSPEQQETLQTFSTQSSMKLEWSQKCLQENNWDYIRSAQAFTHLKAKDKIPEVAFMN
ncbi:Nuclear RNA export factor 1 [Heterocephalus glaber]|uniref:Nuclear RNA export factor 1 n=1 Tax=Heterocephalus glaber TaxID=10181 RepID=G5BGD6_HETGA|nr:Nuclear RNA export factor 1 [Heterocephalus glaber]